MRKLSFLLMLLAVPIAIVLFLHRFGKNRYDIPVYYSNAADMSSDLCVFEEGQHYIPPFSFTDQHNKPLEESWLNDKITVVDFIFTNCPSICKDMSAQMRRVQEAFRDDEKLQLLSVTIDPERDTQEVLKAYSALHSTDENNWRFITGEKSSLYQLARCGFLLPVQAGDGGDDDFIHSDKLVLVDAQRRIRGYYEGTKLEDVDRLIQEIKILKQEE